MSFNRTRAMNLVNRINSCNSWQGLAKIFKNAAKSNKKAWANAFKKLQKFAESYGEYIPYSIFVMGNSKLPFYAFSTLPIATCPGAGECKKWCYSLKAWRYPDAFGRQIQNTILMRMEHGKITTEFEKIPDGSTLRLYVDGDFENVNQVAYWFYMLDTVNPTINAYGYSKSWDEIMEYFKPYGIYNSVKEGPKNYRLNLSGGGNSRTVTIDDMKKLAIVRGEFLAVRINPELMAKTRFSLPEYHAAVRQAGKELTGKPIFSCPGKCGENCSIKGQHACGNTFAPANGMTIAIGIH